MSALTSPRFRWDTAFLVLCSSTSAVASTTVVTLSRVYAGLTKTASLTVTPTAVLYSLTGYVETS